MGKQLFDEVVGEMPPSTLNTVAIVRREKRRRATRVTSFATALVALTLTAGLAMNGAGASVRPSAAPAPARPSQATDDRFALAAYDDRSAAMIAERLRKVLNASFHKEAPGARWISVGDIFGRDGQPPKVFPRWHEGAPAKSEMFASTGGILNDGRKGSFHLIIVADTDSASLASLLKCPVKVSDPSCTEGTGPDGEKTVVWSTTYKPVHVSDIPNTVYTADVGIADGRVLQMAIGNDFGQDGDPAPQLRTPLTSQQLLAIATDIASYIKA